jgi:primase-polymerase (primpol)-like protein
MLCRSEANTERAEVVSTFRDSTGSKEKMLANYNAYFDKKYVEYALALVRLDLCVGMVLAKWCWINHQR